MAQPTEEAAGGTAVRTLRGVGSRLGLAGACALACLVLLVPGAAVASAPGARHHARAHPRHHARRRASAPCRTTRRRSARHRRRHARRHRRRAAAFTGRYRASRCRTPKPAPPAATTPAAGTVRAFDDVVAQISALPYQPNYVPTGDDSAFPGAVPNDAPAEDYTSGSIPGSPDSPAYPPAFRAVTLHSADGAPLQGELAMLPGTHPGVVVVHGFNTNAKQSVVRWAAMLAARGYDVLAADQRDYAAEYQAGQGYPNNLQTFGWKESQDVLAAGRYLRAQPGVASVGLVGFSEGAQNTILAAAQDTTHVFDAAITFSAPADQDTQIYSSAVPPSCQSPGCTFPATAALVALVVPPNTFSDPCQYLGVAASYYHTTPFAILAHESAMHAQTAVGIPLLNFYTADDSLVPAFEASMTAGYERGAPAQRTIEIRRGEHAYYFDRWWQQRAILLYLNALLPRASGNSTAATVNQTPGGAPLSSQTVDLSGATRASADAQLAPFACDTSQPPPGKAG